MSSQAKSRRQDGLGRWKAARSSVGDVWLHHAHWLKNVEIGGFGRKTCHEWQPHRVTGLTVAVAATRWYRRALRASYRRGLPLSPHLRPRFVRVGGWGMTNGDAGRQRRSAGLGGQGFHPLVRWSSLKNIVEEDMDMVCITDNEGVLKWGMQALRRRFKRGWRVLYFNSENRALTSRWQTAVTP